MKFSELENVRIKLNNQGTHEFWKVVDEFGGIRNFADAFDISESKMYNWKSKDSFVPIELVKMIFGNEGSTYVEAFKGEGRSNPVQSTAFPIEENNELLTRISSSVAVNKNGIPLYQTSDTGLLQRFEDLLDQIGDVPYKVYDRDVYELRYPKYLHEIFCQMEYEKDLDALIDENAKINEKIILNNREIDPDRIDRLYHRGKRLKLALMKEDKKEITKLMSEEQEKIRKALK